MKKLVFIFVLLCIISAGCAKKYEPGEEPAGGNMQYDSFRGSSSSIVNRVQFEAFNKCLEQFDFSKYKGKALDVSVYAANSHVTEQIKTILNVLFIKNGILVPKQEYEKAKQKSPKYDYALEINAVCGGYHFYPGFVFYNYQSTARVVMLERTPKGEARCFDSNYQEASLFKPVFTEEFRTSLYVLLFAVLGWIAFRLGAFNGLKRK